VTTALTFTNDFTVGFAQLLADAGIGLAWSDSADYAAGDTGIWVADAPLEVARAVILMPYPLTADPTLSQSLIGLQIRSRSAAADIRDAWALDDATQSALLGNYPLLLSTGVRVTSLRWTSGASLGVDDANHWSVVSNYAADTFRPGPHRN
jgi:hypothetical protein